MIERGGTNEERLYLNDLEFDCEDQICIVRKTDMPNIYEIIQRHKARYMLPAFFVRSGMKVLDFPCGSGYGSEILSGPQIDYEGRDYDKPTIQYCNQFYHGTFLCGDLSDPSLDGMKYDLIACIEGLEHCNQESQLPLIKAFYEALKHDGILVVSSPCNPTCVSGRSEKNPYHKWELTYEDFENLLKNEFPGPYVQIIQHEAILHNGIKSNMLYGICRKGE